MPTLTTTQNKIKCMYLRAFPPYLPEVDEEGNFYINELPETNFVQLKHLTPETKRDAIKVGIIAAKIDEQNPTRVIIGYSIMHVLDQMRNVPFNRNLALKIALGRGEKYFDSKSFSEKHSFNLIREELKYFVRRCRQYYKDKELPAWAEELLKD